MSKTREYRLAWKFFLLAFIAAGCATCREATAPALEAAASKQNQVETVASNNMISSASAVGRDAVQDIARLRVEAEAAANTVSHNEVVKQSMLALKNQVYEAQLGTASNETKTLAALHRTLRKLASDESWRKSLYAPVLREAP